MKLGKLEIIFWSEWKDFFAFKKMNWLNFTFVRLDCEYAPYKETYEINIGLLGFLACFEYFYGIPFNEKETPNDPSRD